VLPRGSDGAEPTGVSDLGRPSPGSAKPHGG
jgi:hypothetical protein